jgi:hypothetical protein
MAEHKVHTFEELVEKRRAADQAHNRVEELRHSFGPPAEHKWTKEQTATYETAWRAWRDLGQRGLGRSRHDVQSDVETAVGRSEPE